MNTFSAKPWLSSYSDGVPENIPAPTETLVDMVWASTRAYRSQVALEFFGATTTYEELREQIARVAAALVRLGVKRGDRVALVLPNCPQHIVAFYAILRVGAVAVEHNPLYTEPELRHQFEDHGAKVAIVWDKVAASVLDFPNSMKVTTIIQVDMTRAMPLSTRALLRLPISKARASRSALTVESTVRGALSWESLLRSPIISNDYPKPALADTAVLQYTSGTTGSPKGAVLSHRNLRANAMQGEAWTPGLTKGNEIFYGVLPMFHAYGLTLCVTFAISMGARLVLFPKFDEALVLTAMKKSPATFLPAVPPIYSRLVTAAAKKKVSLRSIRYAISGAMSLPIETATAWEKATGGILIEGYGMTEASPIALGNPIGPSRRLGTVGVPFPSAEIRVIDPDDSTTDLGFDTEGELLVRGPQVFSAYWNRPDETAQVLLPGGWLRTGDIVSVSPDGFVTIVDRIKELIITGGFNVAPSEVEAALLAHPSVADVAVVGLPTTKGDEDVVAVIVLAAGAHLDPIALKEHCRARISAYKIPKTFVVREELPRSIIGKVLRRVVRDELAS